MCDRYNAYFFCFFSINFKDKLAVWQKNYTSHNQDSNNDINHELKKINTLPFTKIEETEPDWMCLASWNQCENTIIGPNSNYNYWIYIRIIENQKPGPKKKNTKEFHFFTISSWKIAIIVVWNVGNLPLMKLKTYCLLIIFQKFVVN